MRNLLQNINFQKPSCRRNCNFPGKSSNRK